MGAYKQNTSIILYFRVLRNTKSIKSIKQELFQNVNQNSKIYKRILKLLLVGCIKKSYNTKKLIHKTLIDILHVDYTYLCTVICSFRYSV